MADNEQTARKIYQSWNDRDFDFMAEVIAPDGTITDVGSGITFRGPEGTRDYNTAWAEGFPDGRITVDRVISSGDLVVVEYTGRGTHTGTLSSPAGAIPATGRTLTLELCDVIEFADGKVKTLRSYFDTGSMMAQLGLTAEQPATSAQ